MSYTWESCVRLVPGHQLLLAVWTVRETEVMKMEERAVDEGQEGGEGRS